MEYGLIGHPLGHSHSAYVHEKLGLRGYSLVDLDQEDLKPFMLARDFRGINVTIPYKQEVIRYLDELDPIASECGSVNTVVNRNGRLIGYNTDQAGMEYALTRAGIVIRGRKVLILGSGGTSHTAAALCRRLGAFDIKIASRNGEINYSNIARLTDTQVLFNATPVGMYPAYDAMPADPALFPALEGIFDAVFNPLRTRLTLRAAKLGIPTADGLSMLTAQAAAAQNVFLRGGKPVLDRDGSDAEAAAKIAGTLRKKLTAIYLIGMPSSGKSTVGKKLAEITGRAFVDTDAEIVKHFGKQIPDIFAEDGIPSFRAYEKLVVKNLATQTGLVVATGGGVVLEDENVLNMQANGFIIYLRRDTASLTAEGRPLSAGAGALAKMYAERNPLYEAAADAEIENEKTADETAEEIAELFDENFGN